MIEPLLTTGNEKPIEWGKIREKPKGPVAEVLLDKGVVDEASKKGELWPYRKELAYLRPIPDISTYEEFAARLFPDQDPQEKDEDSTLSEESVRTEFRIGKEITECFQKGEDYFGMRWEDWLHDELGIFFDFWRIANGRLNGWHVRRAWLCLAILGKDMQRPGGYTGMDIGLFARIKSRGARRRVVNRLVEFGILKKKTRKGRQPRYIYTETVSLEVAGRSIDLSHIYDIRLMTRWVNDALKGEPEMGDGWDSFPPDVHIIGGPKAPEWVYGIVSAALSLASKAMRISLDLPPGGEVKPPERTIDEFLAMIRKRAKHDLEFLCEISKEVDRNVWKRWEEILYASNTEPVILANLRDIMGERFLLSDEPARILEGFSEDCMDRDLPVQ